MSYDLYPWAWKQKLRAPEKIVLLRLVDRARQHNGVPDFICWPSLSTIGEETGLSKSSVVRCLVQLEERGLIERFRSKGGSSHSSKYKIISSAEDLSNDDQLSQSDTVNCPTEEQIGVQLSQSDTTTVPERHNNCPTVTHEPVIEPIKEPVRKKTASGKIKNRKIEYSPEFIQLWKNYPSRSGENNKAKAFRAYQSRLKEECTHDEMITGVIRYREYCKLSGKTGGEFVKQASTFLGPNRHFDEEWKFAEAKPASSQQAAPIQPFPEI